MNVFLKELSVDTNNVLKIGSNTLNKICETLSERSIGGKFLYVSDSVVDKLYGKTIKSQLGEIGKVREETVNHNTIAYAMSIAERVIATDIDCIVGLGGGKVLDVCKYAAYVSKKPVLSIPTTMANDGICSPVAVLKRQDNKPKSLVCNMPNMLIVDTNLICNGPIKLIKAGIGDTISNYTALLDWELACSRNKDEMNGYAFMLSKNSLDVLMRTQYNSICPEFVEILANSLVLSGIAMGFQGSSRPVSGSEHLFNHALDYYGKTQNLHGIQVALGTIAVLKLIEKNYDNLLKYLHKFEVDINPAHLGIDEETFVYCLQNAPAMRTSRYTYLNETDLSEEKIKKVYKQLLNEL